MTNRQPSATATESSVAHRRTGAAIDMAAPHTAGRSRVFLSGSSSRSSVGRPAETGGDRDPQLVAVDDRPAQSACRCVGDSQLPLWSPGFVVPGEHTTVRADLADCLARALAEPQREHQAVAIGSSGARRAGVIQSNAICGSRSRCRRRIVELPGASRSGAVPDRGNKQMVRRRVVLSAVPMQPM